MSPATVADFERKPSTQMRAVLMVLNADPFLKAVVSPHVDLNLESIYWDKIFKLSMSSGYSAAIAWLYGIWTDEPRPRANIFDGALNLSPALQAAILNALALRWGLFA